MGVEQLRGDEEAEAYTEAVVTSYDRVTSLLDPNLHMPKPSGTTKRAISVACIYSDAGFSLIMLEWRSTILRPKTSKVRGLCANSFRMVGWNCAGSQLE